MSSRQMVLNFVILFVLLSQTTCHRRSKIPQPETIAKIINSEEGGTIEVVDHDNPLHGIKLVFPANSLQSSETIRVSEVATLPPLPKEYNPMGAPFELTPHGISFLRPVRVEIPYTAESLSNAGGADGSIIKVMSFDPKTRNWDNVRVIRIDTAKGIVVAEVEHFSILSMFLHNLTPPVNLGSPLPGDLIYRLSLYGQINNWVPGHVAIFVGEKLYPGSGDATDAVKKYGMYNVIEGMPPRVRFAYYRIPNVSAKFADIPMFDQDGIYMGAREPASGSLNPQQRESVVAFAEAQVGKEYVAIDWSALGRGRIYQLNAKGPDKFSCVGLAERAYEVAGVNGGQGIVDAGHEDTIFPFEQRAWTKPSGGEDPAPRVQWVKLTPDSGTECTLFRAEIAVDHNYGLENIELVTYIQDNGMANPSIIINDKGQNGDRIAGDGIYSAMAAAGASYKMGSEGLNFTASDVFGKSATGHAVYTFTGTCKKEKKKDK